MEGTIHEVVFIDAKDEILTVHSVDNFSYKSSKVYITFKSCPGRNSYTVIDLLS